MSHSCSLFYFAVQWRFPYTIEGFLQAGYDYVGFAEDKPLCRTAISSRPTCLENLKVLLSYEAGLSYSRKLVRFGIALICACEVGNATVAELLLKYGVNPTFVFTENGISWSPLLAACVRRKKFRENGNREMSIQAQFKREKFEIIRERLISYGLDSNHRFGLLNMTAEDYARCSDKFIRFNLLRLTFLWI